MPKPGKRPDEGKQKQREPEDVVNPSGILAQRGDMLRNPVASCRRQRELHLTAPSKRPKVTSRRLEQARFKAASVIRRTSAMGRKLPLARRYRLSGCSAALLFCGA